jgi:tRNA A37 methylthiotransferase MiaB
MAPTLRTVTLGCKVNQYETERLREGLLRLGYRNATAGEPAQLCLVNTCTVTAESDLKSRKAIRRLHRQNPQAEIIVMGCYASRDPQAVAALPGVADVVTDKPLRRETWEAPHMSHVSHRSRPARFSAESATATWPSHWPGRRSGSDG